MKGMVRHFLLAMAVFLITTSISLALVGDVDESDLYMQSDQGLSGIASENSVGLSASIEGTGPVGANAGGFTEPSESSSVSVTSSQGSLYQAPWISGPVEDQMTAESLGLSIPKAESFSPDESLNFVSHPIPTMTVGGSYGQDGSAMQGYEAGSGISKATSSSPGSTSSNVGSTGWYYPGLVTSSNRFYVQTASGLATVAGCSYRGYLPLWAEIKSKGYFFVYEWYPKTSTPLVRLWGWSVPGCKKGWFTGDVPGWHVISYYCGAWSNYIYIYVYPSMYSSIPSSSSSGYLAGEGSAIQPSLPAGAPTPPDIYSENIALPNYSLYRPATGQTGSMSYYDGSAPKSTIPAAAAMYPVPGSYPQGLDGKTLATPTAGGSTSAQTTTSFTTSTLITEGVYGNCPYVDDSGRCQDDMISKVPVGPSNYASHSSKAVFPKPSKCRCNEYYVLDCNDDIDTVAGVYCGDWLPLWSKISRHGEYWSYEWKICHTGGKGCNPEVKNFGYKTSGWYQTWFKGSEPGWHILSYYCNDWSNYIYVYVWPVN
ncbi:MAG TPA: hypothetical protein PLO30_05070 [Methanothrix soehngenii]|nr:hypothetical protein [Methanothrix soehngenii]